MICEGLHNCKANVAKQESKPLTLDRQHAEDGDTQHVHQDDPVAACDRLITLFERVLTLESIGAGVPDDTIQEPMTRYLIAQLRMRIRPALMPRWPAQDPA